MFCSGHLPLFCSFSKLFSAFIWPFVNYVLSNILISNRMKISKNRAGMLLQPKERCQSGLEEIRM